MKRTIAVFSLAAIAVIGAQVPTLAQAQGRVETAAMQQSHYSRSNLVHVAHKKGGHHASHHSSHHKAKSHGKKGGKHHK